MYYPSSENKGADQISGYREAGLDLCFCIGKNWFSHGKAQMYYAELDSFVGRAVIRKTCP